MVCKWRLKSGGGILTVIAIYIALAVSMSELKNRKRSNDRIVTRETRPSRQASYTPVREIVSGGRFRFRCPIASTGILWWLYDSNNRRQLLATGSTAIDRGVEVTRGSGESTLTVHRVELKYDGLYNCTSTGGISFSMRLVVLDPVKIREYSDDLTVRRWDPSIIWCNATGNPEPEIAWYKRIPDGRGIEDLNMKGPSLNLTQTTIQCVGTYVCKATNTIHGTTKMAQESIRISVLYKPIVIVDRLGSSRKYSVRLMCTVLANPNATGVWTIETTSNHRYDRPEPIYFSSGMPNDGERITKSELGFTEHLIHTANCTCSATNRFGTTQAYIYLESD
ncbi:hypothetical protein ScPMuIL_018076 [Solemya velum]